MKSQFIVLFVLAVILSHCSSSAIKGRRYEKENPSKARMFHKKGGQVAPQIFLIEAASQMAPMDYYGYDYPSETESFNIGFDGDVTVEESNRRANFADNNEEDDVDDFIDDDNEQTSRRNKKRNSNFKLKKHTTTGKKETQKKNAPSAASKKGMNKIRLIQLNDNSNGHLIDNIGIRRVGLH